MGTQSSEAQTHRDQQGGALGEGSLMALFGDL